MSENVINIKGTAHTTRVIVTSNNSNMINNEINWRIKNGWDKTKEDVEKDWLDRIPLGKYQMPENIAKVIVSVCSSQFSETTGETINVSGGAVME